MIFLRMLSDTRYLCENSQNRNAHNLIFFAWPMADFHPPSQTLSTTSSLVADLQSLSPQRWDAFVRVYSPLLVFWIRTEKLPTLAHEEVLQESFRTIYAGIGAFKRSEKVGSFRGWLRTIVRRRITDYQRRTAKSPSIVDYPLIAISDQSNSVPEEDSENQAFSEVIARACELVRQTVHPQTWRIFQMCVMESQSPADIATALNVTPSNVRMAKARVLKQLRELLVDIE
jgi:RNA polymerase sigma factor (sigma-70 family)